MNYAAVINREIFHSFICACTNRLYRSLWANEKKENPETFFKLKELLDGQTEQEEEQGRQNIKQVLEMTSDLKKDQFDSQLFQITDNQKKDLEEDFEKSYELAEVNNREQCIID